ncbi:MAG: hypothetical protein PHD48_03215 [Alphaproteobacteria bacterium]|nr:hypothetical protein [Alphaproteobacteria bacterium]
MASAKEKYLAFLGSPEGCRIYKQFKQFLYGPDDALVDVLYRDHIEPRLTRHTGGLFRLADIGGGDGGRITALLNRAHADFPKLHFSLSFVEPSPASFLTAQERFRALGDWVDVTAWNQRFEETALEQESCDLALLIHSIYTFSCDATIQRLAGLKADVGGVLVVANDPEGLLMKLNSRMQAGFQEKRYELAAFLADLSRLHIPFDKTESNIGFTVPVHAFDAFAQAILTMTSMGAYPAFSSEEKEAAHAFLKGLSVAHDAQGWTYEQTEVFLAV